MRNLAEVTLNEAKERESAEHTTGEGTPPGEVGTEQECVCNASGGCVCWPSGGEGCEEGKDAVIGCDGGTGGGGGGDDTMGDDTNFDCHAFGPGRDLRDPDSTERGGVQNLIDRIRTDDLTCSWIRDTAQGMVGHSLQVWDNKIYASGGGVVWGDAPVITKNGVTAFGMHLWTGGMDARVVAHEAMHGLDWEHGIVYNGRTMEQWEHSCT